MGYHLSPRRPEPLLYGSEGLRRLVPPSTPERVQTGVQARRWRADVNDCVVLRAEKGKEREGIEGALKADATWSLLRQGN